MNGEKRVPTLGRRDGDGRQRGRKEREPQVRKDTRAGLGSRYLRTAYLEVTELGVGENGRKWDLKTEVNVLCRCVQVENGKARRGNLQGRCDAKCGSGHGTWTTCIGIVPVA